jgi:hypothetical protein
MHFLHDILLGLQIQLYNLVLSISQANEYLWQILQSVNIFREPW